MENLLRRLPAGCVFSHTNVSNERIYFRIDSNGIKHTYALMPIGLVRHWLMTIL